MRVACVLLLMLVVRAAAVRADNLTITGPDTVQVRSGTLYLRALIWKPSGRGPFPAILLNPGSGRNPQLGAEVVSPGPRSFGAAPARRLPQARPEVLGPIFAEHGYVFMVLFRRGQGLSADRGTFSGDLLDQELAAKGADAANRLQVRLLETDLLDDARAGLTFLRALPEVDPHRVAVVGHSYGGSLTIVLAAADSSLRAAVVFGAGGYGWGRSPQLRARLLAAVGKTVVPMFFVHAANDFSILPGQAMAAEMKRLGREHQLKIYPAFGQTPDEGHSFIYLGVSTWEPNVFSFLDAHMQR